MFSFVIHFAWQVVQAIIACCLLLPVVLHLIYYLKKTLQKQTSVSEELFEEKDYAIIVHVTNPVQNINAVAQSLLQLHYTNYLVYVVINKSSDPLFYSDDARIVLLQSTNQLADSFRLHRYVIENFKRPHTHIVLLRGNSSTDADFLNGLNVCFNQGFQAVQGACVSKNNKKLADVIYTIRNIYNRFFSGDVLFALGSSATLTNCGMAFTISFYKKYLQLPNAISAGVSTALQQKIVSIGYQVAFAKKAIVIEENTFDFQQLKKIHSHGVSIWYKQFMNSLQLLCKGFVCFNSNYFLSGLMRLQLPLFTTLLSAVFCLLVNVLINPVAATLWIICLLLFVVSFLLAARSQVSGNKLSSSANHSVFSRIQNLYEEKTTELYSSAQSL